MKYRWFFVWFAILSYIFSWIDLLIHCLMSFVSRTTSKVKNENVNHLIFSYEFSWTYYYWSAFFILYLSLVLLVPCITNQKKDILFSMAMLFFIHISEDLLFWVNALMIGEYHIGDPLWNPNLFLPPQLQWINLTLGKIYFIDISGLIFFLTLWFLYTNHVQTDIKIRKPNLTHTINNLINDGTTITIKVPKYVQKINELK